MAESVFIPLTKNVLLEYIYGKSTNQADFGINEFNKIESPSRNQVVNPDQYEDGEGPEYTNNVRQRSAIHLSAHKANKYVWSGISDDDINTDWIANEGPENNVSITDSFSINQTEDTEGNLEHGVLYDRVKLHFVTGFNFDEKPGFVLNLQCKDNEGNRISLGNQFFYRLIHNLEFNPSPFIHGEKLFDTFVELQIPSPDNLDSEFRRVEEEFDTEGEKLNNSLLHHLSDTPFDKYKFLQIQFADLQRIEKIQALDIDDDEFVEEEQNYTFAYSINTVNATVPFVKRTANISVDVRESNSGDYFEFKGLYKNRNIDDYIMSLNNRGGNYMLIYDVNVLENLDDGNTINTATHTMYQIEKFDQPITFRPIIKNENSIGLTLEVTMRLFDRATTTQYGRTGRIILTEADDNVVQKYGPYQNVINLQNEWDGFQFKDQKIYNLNPAAQIISLPDTLNDAIIGSQVRYIHRFYDTYNLTFKQRNVEIDEDGKIATDDSTNITQLFGQDRAIVKLDPETNYIRLTFFDTKNNYYLRKNLSNRGQIKINFGDKDSGFSYFAMELDNVNKTNGELVFRIPENDTSALREIHNENPYFRIISLQNSERTVMYRGKFRFSDQTEFEEEVIEEEIENFEERIENREQQIQTLQEELEDVKLNKSNLEEQLSKLNQLVNEQKALINEFRETQDPLILRSFIKTSSEKGEYKGLDSPNFEN